MSPLKSVKSLLLFLLLFLKFKPKNFLLLLFTVRNLFDDIFRCYHGLLKNEWARISDFGENRELGWTEWVVRSLWNLFLIQNCANPSSA